MMSRRMAQLLPVLTRIALVMMAPCLRLRVTLFIAKPFMWRIGQLPKCFPACAARAHLFFFMYFLVFHPYNAIPYLVNVLDVTHRLPCHAVRHRAIGRNCGEIPYFPAGRADRVQITGTLKEGLPCSNGGLSYANRKTRSH